MWVTKKALCMTCFHPLLSGIKLRIRGNRDERYAFFDENRDLVEIENPRPGSIPQNHIRTIDKPVVRLEEIKAPVTKKSDSMDKRTNEYKEQRAREEQELATA